MIKAVLFDLDGVLCHTPDLHYRAFNKALADSGCAKIEPEQHKELYNGLPTRTKLSMLVDRGLVPSNKLYQIASDKRFHTKRLLDDCVRFDPDVFCVVAGVITYGLKWGVVTNAVSDTALFVLTRMELPTPNVLVTNEDATPKPDPAPYALACQRLGVLPHEALAVEDGEYGKKSAKSAGCKVMDVSGPRDLTPKRLWELLKG